MMNAFLIIVSTMLCLLPWTHAAALPDTTAALEATPSLTCTLVDGGPVGGTFCNRYVGTSTITDSVWVTTVTPWATSQTTSVSSDGQTTTAAPSDGATPTTPEPTSTTSSSASTSTDCGEVGVFEIDFDDLPAAGIPSNAPEGPPIFNPADHFYWGASWTYGPPPAQPYRPESGGQLGHSVGGANSSITGSPNAGEVPAKGFGAGPRNANQFYWFNPRSAFVQCDFSDAGAAQQCDFTATAYQYNAQLKEDRVVATQHWAQNRCKSHDCDLNHIIFDPPFSNLSALSFYGVIEGKIVDFYVDSVRLEWYDNSCEAGVARASSRK